MNAQEKRAMWKKLRSPECKKSPEKATHSENWGGTEKFMKIWKKETFGKFWDRKNYENLENLKNPASRENHENPENLKIENLENH